MASTSDFKNGLTLNMNHDLLTIIEFQHVKPGKGPAFVRTKLRSLKTGKVLQHTFTAGFKIDIARVERRPYQYLYKDDYGYNFMHRDTFEQMPIPEDIISASAFLKEGQEVEILYHADTETPLTCDLPAYVVLEITYAEPGEKGNTATNALKNATVETGANVKVPLFINEGDKIKVDTRSGDYSERVKG
jgi:elongation factor P